MAGQVVTTTFRLNVQDFIAGVKVAAINLDAVARKGGKTSRSVIDGFERVERVVRSQQGEWALLADRVSEVDSAITATSNSYDTFQRSTQSGMREFLGSASAIITQLDNLDAWVSKSPFTHGVWVESQKALASLGTETHTVGAYLSSLYEATATAGTASSISLQALVSTLAKVSGTVKTADNEFGQLEARGVGAGNAITSSMIDAGNEVLRFMGETEETSATLAALPGLVRQQSGAASTSTTSSFRMAFAQIKTDWQDLGRSLASPLGETRGHDSITALLTPTDTLVKSFQGLSEPIKNTESVLETTANAARSTSDAFLTLAPRAATAYDAFKRFSGANIPVLSTMASNTVGAVQHLRDIGTYAQLAGSYMGDFGQNFRAAQNTSSSFFGAIGAASAPIAASIGGVAKSTGSALLGAVGGLPGLGVTAAIMGVTAAIGEFSRRAEEAKARADTYAQGLAGIESAAERTATAMRIAAGTAIDGGELTWGIVQKTRSGFGSFPELLDNLGVTSHDYAKLVVGTKAERDEFVANLEGRPDPNWDKHGTTANGTLSLAQFFENQVTDGKYAEFKVALDKDSKAYQTNEDARKKWEEYDREENSTIGAAAAIDKQTESTQAATEANRKYGATADEVSASERRASDALADGAQKANMQRLALEKLRVAKLGQLVANGNLLDAELTAADAVADAWDTVNKGGKLATDDAGNFDKWNSDRETVNNLREVALTGAAELQSMSDAGYTQSEIDDHGAQKAAEFDSLVAETAGKDANFAAFREEFGVIPTVQAVVIDVSANTEMADAEIMGLVESMLETQGQIIVDASTDPAAVAVAEQLGLIESEPGMFIIDAETDLADAALMMQLGKINTETGILKIDGNTRLASEAAHGIKLEIDDLTGMVKISANSGLAKQVADETVNAINQRTAFIKVSAANIDSGISFGGTARASGSATGGAIYGPGTGTSDSIPVWLSNGEHVLTAAEVRAFGGQNSIYSLRSAIRSGDLKRKLGFASGGAVGAAVPLSVAVPTGYRTPQVNVSAVVENPWTGEQVNARVRSVAIDTTHEWQKASA